jgi:ribosomal protein S18 acetylase RimI-like enzyme
MEVPSLDDAVHFGVKGMKWGIRKDYLAYQNKVHRATPGALKTRVVTKNGDVLTIEKEKPGALALAVGKLIGRKPPDYLSAMVIRDKDGKKVGSFQAWREGKHTIRGEWLEVKKSAQGQGYSEAAIRGLLASAKKQPGLKEVRLQVPSDAAAAKHIYSKLGFAKDKDLGVTPTYGNIEDWVHNVDGSGGS